MGWVKHKILQLRAHIPIFCNTQVKHRNTNDSTAIHAADFQDLPHADSPTHVHSQILKSTIKKPETKAIANAYSGHI